LPAGEPAAHWVDNEQENALDQEARKNTETSQDCQRLGRTEIDSVFAAQPPRPGTDLGASPNPGPTSSALLRVARPAPSWPV